MRELGQGNWGRLGQDYFFGTLFGKDVRVILVLGESENFLFL
jgi:hypothetical protein